MKENVLKIRKIPIILDIEEIVFNERTKNILKEKLPLELFDRAKSNSKNVNIYRIVYKSNNHKVTGFIVEPKKGNLLPSIIYNRGGSREFGAIRLGQLFLKLAEFAQWGYIVVASQYSGNDGSEGKDEMGGKDIEDVLNLYKILRKYHRADASRIGMYGHSRGGMMTYLSMARAKWIKTAVVGAAPADEVSAPKFRKGWAEHQKSMYGGSLKEKKRRSVLYWPDRLSKKTPLLLMHGSSDWRVNPLDSLKLAQELYAQRVPFRLVFFEGGDHGLTEFKDEEKAQIKQWFERYLKGDRGIDLKPHGE